MANTPRSRDLVTKGHPALLRPVETTRKTGHTGLTHHCDSTDNGFRVKQDLRSARS